MSIDGYRSHLKSQIYLIFLKYLITMLLKNGAMSQTNQAFDQLKAKKDKRNIRILLDMQRFAGKLIDN